jgi:phage baseplate assembly protein W
MELYIKIPEDPNYIPGQATISDEIEQLKTQIETILFTKKGDVMGDSNFGANIEDLIYEFNFNENELKREINDQLMRYCPLSNKYNVRVEVEFYRGKIRDAAELSVIIDGRNRVSVNVQ